MRNGKSLRIADSVSLRVARAVRKAASARFAAFTVAELIVVVTVLAIISTIGFIALSGYSQDARNARNLANIRAIQTAISTESASTGNSPRHYVAHDPTYALSWAFLYVQGKPVALTGGNLGEPPTDSNYTTWVPRWDRLKLNSEKFLITSRFPSIGALVANAAKSGFPVVGAADLPRVLQNGQTRNEPYFQVAGISSETWTRIVGNFPTATFSGTVAVAWTPIQTDTFRWLVANPQASSADDVFLVEWSKGGSVPGSGASNGETPPEEVETFSIGGRVEHPYFFNTSIPVNVTVCWRTQQTDESFAFEFTDIPSGTDCSDLAFSSFGYQYVPAVQWPASIDSDRTGVTWWSLSLAPPPAPSNVELFNVQNNPDGVVCAELRFDAVAGYDTYFAKVTVGSQAALPYQLSSISAIDGNLPQAGNPDLSWRVGQPWFCFGPRPEAEGPENAVVEVLTSHFYDAQQGTNLSSPAFSLPLTLDPPPKLNFSIRLVDNSDNPIAGADSGWIYSHSHFRYYSPVWPSDSDGKLRFENVPSTGFHAPMYVYRKVSNSDSYQEFYCGTLSDMDISHLVGSEEQIVIQKQCHPNSNISGAINFYPDLFNSNVPQLPNLRIQWCVSQDWTTSVTPYNNSNFETRIGDDCSRLVIAYAEYFPYGTFSGEYEAYECTGGPKFVTPGMHSVRYWCKKLSSPETPTIRFALRDAHNGQPLAWATTNGFFMEWGSNRKNFSLSMTGPSDSNGVMNFTQAPWTKLPLTHFPHHDDALRLAVPQADGRTLSYVCDKDVILHPWMTAPVILKCFPWSEINVTNDIHFGGQIYVDDDALLSMPNETVGYSLEGCVAPDGTPRTHHSSWSNWSTMHASNMWFHVGLSLPYGTNCSSLTLKLSGGGVSKTYECHWGPAFAHGYFSQISLRCAPPPPPPPPPLSAYGCDQVITVTGTPHVACAADSTVGGDPQNPGYVTFEDMSAGKACPAWFHVPSLHEWIDTYYALWWLQNAATLWLSPKGYVPYPGGPVYLQWVVPHYWTTIPWDPIRPSVYQAETWTWFWSIYDTPGLYPVRCFKNP